MNDCMYAQIYVCILHVHVTVYLLCFALSVYIMEVQDSDLVFIFFFISQTFALLAVFQIIKVAHKRNFCDGQVKGGHFLSCHLMFGSVCVPLDCPPPPFLGCRVISLQFFFCFYVVATQRSMFSLFSLFVVSSELLAATHFLMVSSFCTQSYFPQTC